MKSRFRKAVLCLFMLVMTETTHAQAWKIETLGIPINAVNHENSGGVVAMRPLFSCPRTLIDNLLEAS